MVLSSFSDKYYLYYLIRIQSQLTNPYVIFNEQGNFLPTVKSLSALRILT